MYLIVYGPVINVSSVAIGSKKVAFENIVYLCVSYNCVQENLLFFCGGLTGYIISHTDCYFFDLRTQFYV